MFRLLVLLVVVLVSPLASDAQDQGRAPSWVPASPNVVLELQVALTVAIERFQAMDRAAVLGNISNQYRTESLTKPAIAEQLRVMAGFESDSVRYRLEILPSTAA